MRRKSFYALPQSHWQMLARPPFSYLEILNKTDEAIESNAELARAIAKFGLMAAIPGEFPEMPEEWRGVAKHRDIDKARSTLRQFFRDWSAAGAPEREACYGPVLQAIEAEASGLSGRRPLEVLVPGAGLGRLVFELCLRGCKSEGNEISYHQLVASSYVLNFCKSAGQHTIFPWIHTFSNHETRENHLRSYPIPDVHPATVLSEAGQAAGTMSMSAADFLCLYADDAHQDR
jgi:carnosine N-methyltransferase